jgi:hypothetical protein
MNHMTPGLYFWCFCLSTRVQNKIQNLRISNLKILSWQLFTYCAPAPKYTISMSNSLLNTFPYKKFCFEKIFLKFLMMYNLHLPTLIQLLYSNNINYYRYQLCLFTNSKFKGNLVYLRHKNISYKRVIHSIILDFFPVSYVPRNVVNAFTKKHISVAWQNYRPTPSSRIIS